MLRIDEDAVAAAILAAPGWARIGLSLRDPKLRERAAGELAKAIVAQDEGDAPDPNQLTLAL